MPVMYVKINVIIVRQVSYNQVTLSLTPIQRLGN